MNSFVQLTKTRKTNQKANILQAELPRMVGPKNRFKMRRMTTANISIEGKKSITERSGRGSSLLG